MTPSQCKEARRLLGMPRDRLAATSDVPMAIIRQYEKDGRLPRARGGETGEERLAAIRAALEATGAEFIEQNGGGPGIRRKGG
jgi:hypothetical protein